MKIKNLFKVLIAITVTVSLFACSGSDDKDPELSLTKDMEVYFDAKGKITSGEVEVKAKHTDWSVEVTEGNEWLSVSKNGNKVSFTAKENNESTERKGKVLVTSTEDSKLNFTINVTQEGKELSFKVNVNDLQFSGDEDNYNKETRSLVITSNFPWEITEMPNWLSTSNKSGNGNATVTFKATSANMSSNDKNGTIKIVSEGESLTVQVVQHAGLAQNCNVRPINMVTIYNGIAFDYECDKAVSYYYRGYMEKAAVGTMTEKEIIKVLENNFDRYTQADNQLAVFDGLDQGETYVVYTVGYNSEGKRGDLAKKEVTVPTLKANEPLAIAGDVQASASYWYWSTQKSATCYSYYMITTEDEDFAYTPDVYQAWLIKDAIRQNLLEEFLNDGDWQRVRTGDLLAIITWGLDKNENFANRIYWCCVKANSSSPQRIKPKNYKKTDRNYPIPNYEKVHIYKR